MTGFFENYVVLPFVMFKNFFLIRATVLFTFLYATNKSFTWKHSGKEQFVDATFLLHIFYYIILY